VDGAQACVSEDRVVIGDGDIGTGRLRIEATVLWRLSMRIGPIKVPMQLHHFTSNMHRIACIGQERVAGKTNIHYSQV